MASADYISREAFAAEMKERQTEAGKWLREAKDHDTAVRADAVLSFLCEVKLTLDKISAADVRPVVRGQWEDVSVRDYSTNINGGMELHVASMFCPICHRWHNEVYHYGNPTEMAHFCPNCGAWMEKR